jgi:hypothetical protein
MNTSRPPGSTDVRKASATASDPAAGTKTTNAAVTNVIVSWKRRRGMSRRKNRKHPKYDPLTEAQSTVHTYKLAIEQALPETEVYEYMAWDFMDAVRWEDICFIRTKILARGYEEDCICGLCLFCRVDELLKEIEGNLY